MIHLKNLIRLLFFCGVKHPRADKAELSCYVTTEHNVFAPVKRTGSWRRTHAQCAPRQQHQDRKRSPGTGAASKNSIFKPRQL